jgi:hypothetical protein
MSFCDIIFIFALIGGFMSGFVAGCGFAKWYLIDRTKVLMKGLK